MTPPPVVGNYNPGLVHLLRSTSAVYWLVVATVFVNPTWPH